MTSTQSTAPQFDAIVIGAGVNGLYTLYRLRELGLSVRTLEAGAGVGGTWYWNRYPGARLDSESYSYGYFFSEEIQQEWSWSEEFAGQPELERYFNFVADRLQLRPDIELNTRVASAHYDAETASWTLRTTDGRTFTARFVVFATGILSRPLFPEITGLDEFSGAYHHTALWPHEPVELAGKRVAVIGTGASGVQLIPSIADQVEHLTVFQRTPNWCAPSNNFHFSAERVADLKSRWREIRDTCRETPGGFIHSPRDESALDVSADERQALYEKLWNATGLALSHSNFRDLLTNREANDTVSSFIAEKIRTRVHNPDVADQLIPKDHGFAMKRPPLETNYYEAYNRDNVELISLDKEPIVRATEQGLETTRRNLDFDVIILATGFHAGTGPMLKVDITGEDGAALQDYWADGPRTLLGVLVVGFPNMFIVSGPQGGTAGNIPRFGELQANWIVECVRHMKERGYQKIEATPEAEEAWVEHAIGTVEKTLLSQANSWYFGSNVPGKKRAFQLYAGSQSTYRSRLDEAAREYQDFKFTSE
ncbi:flavin-containing monooxygenase [Streptomyces sp. NPDC090499]|uniref:flavin-containing monooxygenase n=1 Tax=Streptomyces sp. NPDC090499 TaxID=3365965 RepID=UPI0038032EE8